MSKRPARPSIAANIKRATNTPPALTPAKRERVVPDYRKGKRTLSVWLREEAVRQLKGLSAETDRTVEDLMVEAMNDFFVKSGRQPLA
jgi:hypothetical protein